MASKTCFVVQRFDRSTYDGLFDNDIAPALREAGVEPYRVDRDPRTIVPIEDIENGIRNAVLVFAEISEDNPNVWFEVGFARACKKPIVFACNEAKREHLPFDVRQLAVIYYSTGNTGVLNAFRAKVTEKARAFLAASQERDAKESNPVLFEAIAPVGADIDELGLTILRGMLQAVDTLNGSVSVGQLQAYVEVAGFSRMGFVLGVDRLIARGYLCQIEEEHWNERYQALMLTDAGRDWVRAHEKLFSQREARGPAAVNLGEAHDAPSSTGGGDEDIPF